MKKVFFLETKAALERITELFDIIHPLFLSYRNHRADVIQFYAAHPDATDQEYKGRFHVVYPRTNYKKYFVEETEESMENELSWIILTNLFAIYEGWLEELVCKLIGPGNSQIINSLQFVNYTNALQTLFKNANSMMDDAFKAKLIIQNNHYIQPITALTNHLKCYRFFKELRNCNTHQGRRVTQRVVDAYNNFYGIQNALPQFIGIQFFVPNLNEKYILNFHKVGAFCNVLLDIIFTYDIYLSASDSAEKYLFDILKDFKHPLSQLGKLTDDEKKNRCARICAAAGFVEPIPTDELFQFMYDNYIVH